MNLCKFLKSGFFILLFTSPIAAMEIEEENFGEHFNRLSPEIREKFLPHLSHSTWSALSRTSKDWQRTIAPFLFLSSHHIDFEKHFSERTTFSLGYAKSSYWVLAREYEEITENPRISHLSLVKIDTCDRKETVIKLNRQLGWSGEVSEGPILCTGAANPVCFSSCPHGGVFVYAPLDTSSDLTYVNDLGTIDTQPVLSHYKNSGYVEMRCGETHIALNSAYASPSPVLFIPYQINDHQDVNYTPESDTTKWPRFQKIPDRGHNIWPSEDKFLIEINNGADEFTGIPNHEKTLIIDPNEKEEEMVKIKRNNSNLSIDPTIAEIIKKTIFPQHYKLFSTYHFIKQNNFLFLLGRLAIPLSGGEDIYGVNERYRTLEYRKESPYPYGVVLVKNLQNNETISKTLLFDNTQFSDIQHELMRYTDSYLFITTHFRKRATPKLTAIDIKPIKRLLLDKSF